MAPLFTTQLEGLVHLATISHSAIIALELTQTHPSLPDTPALHVHALPAITNRSVYRVGYGHPDLRSSSAETLAGVFSKPPRDLREDTIPIMILRRKSLRGQS